MKTKMALTLLGLGLVCTSAYAAHGDETPMPVSNDINVTAPDQSGMWSFGATVVYMQPTNSTFNYADSITQTGYDQNTYHYGVDEGYYWWFGADVSYAFPGNGRDVTLAYEGLHGESTDNTTSQYSTYQQNSNGIPLGLFSPFSPFDSEYLTAAGKMTTNYNAADLVFGQKLDVGQRIRLHPFVGLRYATIDVQGSGEYYLPMGFYSGSGRVVDQTENALLKNKFSGIGPRLGSDAQVNLGHGFSLRGRLGLSALIGSRRSSLTDLVQSYDSVTGVTDGASLKYTIPSETNIIPEIDGRLGFNYTYTGANDTALGFEMGWQATNYFNVIADQNEVGAWHNTGQANAKTTNFGLEGPYARIQLDVA